MRRPGAWAAAGAALALLMALALFDPRLFTGGDNAEYYAMAKALATGRGYVDLTSPGAPPQTQYPPGFPVALVPFYLAFGGAYVGVKLASWVAMGAALWATWALARRDPAVPAWAAAAAVGLVGLYPVLLDYAHWVLSEPTYLAVSLGALWAFRRAEAPDDEADDDRWTGWWSAGLALSVAAFAVRTAGIVLPGAALAWAVLRRRWRRAAVAGAAILVGAVPWLVWTARNPPPTGGYLEQLLASNPYDPTSPRIGAAGLVERAFDNLRYYGAAEWPRLFWPDLPLPRAAIALAIVLGGGLLVYGVVRALRSRSPVVWDVYALFAVLVLLVWPWSGDRFLLTIAPLLWLYLLVGLDGVARLLVGRPAPAIVLAGTLAAFLLVGAARRVPDQWAVTRAHMEGDELAGYPPFWQDYFEAARWIGANAPDAVIVARKPTLAWYWSGRPSVVYPFREDPAATWRFIRERGATHVLLDPLPSTRLYLTPALQAHLAEIQAVHVAPSRNAFVLRIEPGSPSE